MNVGQRAKNQKWDQTVFQDWLSLPGDFQKLLDLSASVSSTVEWGQKMNTNLCLSHRIIVRMKGDKVLANNTNKGQEKVTQDYLKIWHHYSPDCESLESRGLVVSIFHSGVPNCS